MAHIFLDQYFGCLKSCTRWKVMQLLSHHRSRRNLDAPFIRFRASCVRDGKHTGAGGCRCRGMVNMIDLRTFSPGCFMAAHANNTFNRWWFQHVSMLYAWVIMVVFQDRTSSMWELITGVHLNFLSHGLHSSQYLLRCLGPKDCILGSWN